MKKIIHKLKKNRLVSKITCFSVILMILISSLTVSSFAADDYVIEAGSYTPKSSDQVVLPDSSVSLDIDFKLILPDETVNLTTLIFVSDAIGVSDGSPSVNVFYSGEWLADFTLIVLFDTSVTQAAYDLFFNAFENVPSSTESLTDIWTSILNWITGSLSSVQNVFFTSASQTSGSITLTSTGDIYTADLGFIPSAGDSFTLFFTVFGESVSLDFVFEFNDDIGDSFLTAESTFDNYFIRILNESGTSIIYLNTSVPGDFNGNSFDYTYFSGSGSLTFLGTLSVVGVAIAIILLLISVVINFLKLRG